MRGSITQLRLGLLKTANEVGGLSSPFLSKSEEKAAFSMTQMSEPLLRVAYWGPFDYVITDAGISALSKREGALQAPGAAS
jgi:hypothetical protein